MAGIGFELRKAITRGGLGSFIKAAFSGMMIVAGPWLLSIVGITAIQRFMSFAVSEAPDHFMGVIIYSYAWSLFLFGGIHYIFTRMMADMLYLKDEGKAAGALIFFMVPTIVVTAAISIVSVVFINPPVAQPILFKISTVILFLSINLIWLIMIFISLLKWYGRILFIYATGMFISLFLIYLLGKPFGTAGALLGYALGQSGIALLLFILSMIAYKPVDIFKNGPLFLRYVKKFLPLLLTGIFYNWGIWIDKMVFWFTRGDQIPGTFVRLFGTFDISVYLANLSMIPGLIFFIVASETEFYLELRRFLVSLGSKTFAEIQRRKHGVLQGVKKGVSAQSLFQGVVTVTLILLGPIIAQAFGLETNTFRIVLTGVYFHLIFLTLMNFHFYLEFYRHALISSALFFFVNFLAAIASTPRFDVFTPGISYLFGAIAAGVYSGVTLFVSGRKMDRILLVKASGLS